MYGGVRGRTNLALVLGAGLFVAATPALAADLGSDGIADLEERVAELEATTARKGNRKVSLTISGYVNEQIQFWDDGAEQNVYIGTNESDQTRLRFVGKAKINADWSAGYIIELGFRGAGQGTWNATTPNGTNAGINLRHSAWFLESKTFGKTTVGLTSAANDSITELTVAKTITVEKPIQIFTPNGGFQIRKDGVAGANATWSQLSSIPQAGEGDRYNVIRYDTPEFGGFIASASWGEDDLWAVALRYSGEVHGFKLAGGLGYSEISDKNRNLYSPGAESPGEGNELGLSVSALHVDSGLFATFAYGRGKDELRPGNDVDESWNIQAGIQKKFIALGATTVYGEYYEGDFGAAYSGAGVARTFGTGAGNNIIGSDVDVWGLAAVQNIEAAALDLYISYRHYSADIYTAASPGGASGADDFQTVFSGAKISF
jgi:predicted porin